MEPAPGVRARFTQLRRGTLEFCVLATLRRGEQYAYEIVIALSDQRGMGTTSGTIYPLLARMQSEGWVRSSLRESPVGPARRYYELSEPGRQALAGFAREWATFRGAVDHFMNEDTLR